MPPSSQFKRGAIPTPQYKLHNALSTGRLKLHHAFFSPPPQFCGNIPAKMSVLGNSTYGDCHSADSEVLTEHGWTPWPEYDGKALLATVNQNTLLMEFQAPLRVVRKDHDGPMAYGTHRGQDFAVTPRHRFFLRPYKIVKDGGKYVPGASGYGAFEFRTAENVPTRFMIPGAPSGFMGARLDKLTIGNRQWDGTDFLRLLSLILSDGYVSDGETNRQRSSFCCFREDRLDMVRAFAYKLGIREEASRPGVWVLGDPALADWLRANLYTGEERRSPFKKIPALVKCASQDQIEEFLRFYGDQSFCNGRDFYTSSRRLADDLQELLLRTGKRTNIAERAPRTSSVNDRGVQIEGKHPSFDLHVWEDSDVVMKGSGNRDATMAFDHYRGEVFCATVPNGTLVTRRNGSVLVSSNCVSAEEGAAIESYSTLCGVEYVIQDQTVIDFARKHNWLNGADLLEVIQGMEKEGMKQGGDVITDGASSVVNYADENALQAALCTGPVKLGMDANALPSGAGQKNGWTAFGGRPGQFGNEDHSTGLWAYGPIQWLAQQIAAVYPGTPIPSQTGMGYVFYTWGTVGIVDHAWIMSTVGEAFLRTPTTLINGKALTPAPPIPPDWTP